MSSPIRAPLAGFVFRWRALQLEEEPKVD